MKILYFHQHFTTPSKAGGTRSFELSQRLLSAGHQVTMVCGAEVDFNLPETEKQHIARGDIDGIDVIQIKIPYSNSQSLAERTKGFVRFAYLGGKVALKENYDLLFATSTPLTAGIPGILMKLMGRKQKFVFEVRDLWPELPKALGMKNPILLYGMHLLEKWSYNAADACVGLSPGIKQGIEKKLKRGKPVAMIPNGCDTRLFLPGDRSNLSLRGISPDDTVAIFTGAHGIANGLNAVLDAAVELKSMGRNDIKIAFIGKGGKKEELQKRVAAENIDNCLFFDPVSKLELNQIVASADIGLMVLANIPAFYYGTSPNKFFDYISSGLPVLNNYPGWLADNINKNECGVAIKPNDPEVFAETLIYMADHKEEMKKYGKNARTLAENTFDRDVLGKQFVEFIESV